VNEINYELNEQQFHAMFGCTNGVLNKKFLIIFQKCILKQTPNTAQILAYIFIVLIFIQIIFI